MSSINPNNIDGTYPIAGQDNDSQGFRDNFTNIKNNFTFAYDELTDLQSKAVLKSALNGSTLDNTLTYTSLNTSGNVLATGAKVFGNTTLGLAGVISGQFHSVVGNITQTSSGGAVYINTTGNVLATGLTVFGNTTHGLAGVVSGQFHSFVGNITQTTSGGAVYINTTGNVLAASVTTGALINNGNIIIADPIGAGSFGSNLTVKGTINYKTQDSANNFSVATTSKSLTLAPGGDQFLLLNITANCAIGYNATIVRGHQTTVHVKNSAGALAYVIVPNNNTTTGNAFIGLADGQVGQFVFTSYGTDAGNIMVAVTR